MESKNNDKLDANEFRDKTFDHEEIYSENSQYIPNQSKFINAKHFAGVDVENIDEKKHINDNIKNLKTDNRNSVDSNIIIEHRRFKQDIIKEDQKSIANFRIYFCYPFLLVNFIVLFFAIFMVGKSFLNLFV